MKEIEIRAEYLVILWIAVELSNVVVTFLFQKKWGAELVRVVTSMTLYSMASALLTELDKVPATAELSRSLQMELNELYKFQIR